MWFVDQVPGFGQRVKVLLNVDGVVAGPAPGPSPSNVLLAED